MKLSRLKELKTSRSLIDVFKGYNHNIRIGEGEFYDMTNLSSDNYPVISPRSQRGVYAEPMNPRGLIAKDVLCYVDGADFVIGENRVSMELAVDDTPKTLVSMGAYVIIMPDKKWINTIPKSEEPLEYEWGSIEASVETSDTVYFKLCKIDGVEYDDAVVQPKAPSKPENGDLWIDTSSTPHALKQYSYANDTWVSIPTTYIKIECTGIGEDFNEGDGVTISGVWSESLSDLNSTMTIMARGDNYIVVTGILDSSTAQEEPLTVKRQMPNMDFIIESGNRLWGCRYGEALNGEMVNEIYASKLGDFKNWNTFAGISTDSYAATVGSDGPFTGAIAHRGYPLFFKENCMYKVYGNFPSAYQIQENTCRGVQKGCSNSLAIVNEVLFYKSRYAICSYDSSLPSEISFALGDVSYSDAVAGALGNKYYISMADNSGEYHLFVFDTMKGMWHREDNTRAICFCNFQNDLFYIDRETIRDIDVEKIMSIKGTGTPETAPIKWEAVTGVIGTDSPDKKYVSRMDVRMLLKVGSTVTFLAEYDSCGEWEYLFTMQGTSLQSFAVPIKPKRCDHFRLKIIGNGEAKIFSICKTIEQGSDA